MPAINEIQLDLIDSPALKREAGVVYTKPWVVEIILDLAGYTIDKPLANLVALEPSAGDGAFLRAMVQRLVKSCKQHHIPLASAKNALRAYEIDPFAASQCISAIRSELTRLGVDSKTGTMLARGWVRTEDFLEPSFVLPHADFVIGNPPYIRLEEIPEQKANLYRTAYATMRGRADIYIAFYQAALSYLKAGGVCAYICADRWLRNDYGRALRAFITSDYSVRYIIETHNVDAFRTDVSAYPAITVISREKQGATVVVKALRGIESATTDYIVSHVKSARSNSVLSAARFAKWFEGDEPWSCSSPESLSFLKSLEDKFPLLESKETGTTIGIGVASGADSVFITDKRPDIEDERLLPMAMARDLRGANVDWSGHYLVNPWDKDGLVDLEKYPKLARYFSKHKEILQGRHIARKRAIGWHRTIDRVNIPLITQPKLYIADISSRLAPTLDCGITYPHHNLYWITSTEWDLRVLGALLMSDIGEFFIRCYCVLMRGGFFRLQAQYLRRIRVPNPRTISKEDAAKLVQAFKDRDVALANKHALKLYGIKDLPTPN